MQSAPTLIDDRTDGKDIVDIIAGEPGRKSDITLFRQGHKGFSFNQKFQGDKGYIRLIRK